jgi:hypothetical protein
MATMHFFPSWQTGSPFAFIGNSHNGCSKIIIGDQFLQWVPPLPWLCAIASLTSAVIPKMARAMATTFRFRLEFATFKTLAIMHLTIPASF